MSDVVFKAVVTKRNRVKKNDPDAKNNFCWKYSEDQPDCGPKTAHLKFKKIWKGKLEELPSIYSEDACYRLGSYLFKDETYVFSSKIAEAKKPYDLISSS